MKHKRRYFENTKMLPFSLLSNWSKMRISALQ